MQVTDNDIKSFKKGYFCKICHMPDDGKSLFIRPNKTYVVGDSPSSHIRVNSQSESIFQLTCDEDLKVVIDVVPSNTETVKINNVEVRRKQVLNHLDTITVGNGNIQFYSYFNNTTIRLNCKNLHSLLLQQFPLFKQHFESIKDKTANLKDYSKGLKEILSKTSKINQENYTLCNDICKSFLAIVMNDNPPDKLNMECMKYGVDTRRKVHLPDHTSKEQPQNKSPPKTDLINLIQSPASPPKTDLIDLLQPPISPPNTLQQITEVHDQTEMKEDETKGPSSTLLIFGESDDSVDELEEYRKRQMSQITIPSKRGKEFM
ncbi:FHA domain-containing protein [Entamoeba marina]